MISVKTEKYLNYYYTEHSFLAKGWYSKEEEGGKQLQAGGKLWLFCLPWRMNESKSER